LIFAVNQITEKMTETNHQPEFSRQTLEMVTVANDFCMTLDQLEKHKKPFLIDYLQKICPLLYIKGALLEEVEVLNPEMNERFLTEKDWESLFNDLRQLMKEDDEFWYIDNSNDSDNEPIKASLAECITDIYQDLKDFLILYQKNSLDAKQNAINQLVLSFPVYWGPKLLLVAKKIHSILQDESSAKESDDYPDLF
jgi:hypothetical protein